MDSSHLAIHRFLALGYTFDVNKKIITMRCSRREAIFMIHITVAYKFEIIGVASGIVPEDAMARAVEIARKHQQAHRATGTF